MLRWHGDLPRSPAGWQLCMAAYAMSVAFSWLQEPYAFQVIPVYQGLLALGIPQRVWVVILAAYAVASAVCLVYGTSGKKALVGVFGAMLWGFLGITKLVASMAMPEPYPVSPSAVFELFGCLGCLVCVLQWETE